MSALIDTHCHLDWSPLCEDVEGVLTRAREAGLSHAVTIGTDFITSRKNLELARNYDMLSAAVGIHPNESEGVTEDKLHAIEELSHDPNVVAIGEIGLDFYREYASAEAQHWVLSHSLEIARRRDLPVVIHCRDAYAELIEVLQHEPKSNRGVIHCASGPPEFIEAALELGFYVSFAGNVTYPSAKELRALIPLVPDDRIMVETDAPFLAPQPKRGKKNEPAFVVHTAEFIAEARQMSLEDLARVTTQNACTLFGIGQSG